MTDTQAIQFGMDMYNGGFDTAVEHVLEAIDKHIDFANNCHEDVSRLMELRKDIEQMKGGEQG